MSDTITKEQLERSFNTLSATVTERMAELTRLREDVKRKDEVIRRLVEALRGSSADRGLIAEYGDALDAGLRELA